MRGIVQFVDGTVEGYFFEPDNVLSSRLPDFAVFSTDKNGKFPVYIAKAAVLRITAVTEKQFKEFTKLAQAHAHAHENH